MKKKKMNLPFKKFYKCSPLFELMDLYSFEYCDTGSNSLILKKFGDIYIFSFDKSKYLYYEYALKNKFKHIPRLINAIYDAKQKFSLIVRENLYPVVNTKKLARIECIKSIVLNEKKLGLDPIADELIKFYYDESFDNKLEFDLGPHFIMENVQGKLVVCDAFIQRKFQCQV